MVASLNVPFTCMSFMDWLIFPVNKLTNTKKLFEELTLQNVDYKQEVKFCY